MIEWVTSTIVHGRSVHTRCSSRLSVSRVQRVERGEGLVEEEHRRRADEPAGDRGPLAHADRELRRPAPFEAADTGELAQRRGPRVPLGPRDAAHAQRQRDVRLDVHPRQEVGFLEHDGELIERGAVRRGRRPTPGGSSTVTAPSDGAVSPAMIRSSVVLPQPGRTDERDDLVVLDREVDRFEREHRARSVAEPLPDAGEVDGRHQGAFAAVPVPRPIMIDTSPDH